VSDTASRTRLPPAGPRDPAVWWHLVLMDGAGREYRAAQASAEAQGDDPAAVPFSGGVIERATGLVWLVSSGTRTMVLLDLSVIDELVRLGWLDDAAHDELTLTERGRYWLERYTRLNGGR
jgi:hypothetical protein